MGIVYEDQTRIAGAKFDTPVHLWNGTKHYLKHYGNLLYLQFIERSSQVQAEKNQARKEIAIAEKKIAFWRRHPLYVHEDAVRGVAELKRQWSAK